MQHVKKYNISLKILFSNICRFHAQITTFVNPMENLDIQTFFFYFDKTYVENNFGFTMINGKKEGFCIPLSEIQYFRLENSKPETYV